MAFKEPSLKDIEGAGVAVTNQAVTAAKSRFKEPTLRDMGVIKTKAPEPFEGGSTLQVTVPLPGQWPTVDTGIPISKGTTQFLAGAGKNFVDKRRRIEQLVGKNGAQEEIDTASTADRELMSTTPAMFGNAAPDIIASVPVANTMRAAGITGGVLGAMQPTTSEDGSGATLINTGVGVLGGAGGQKVANLATDAVGKVINVIPRGAANAANAVLSRLPGRRRLPSPEVPYADPQAKAVQQLIESQGVTPSIGDIDPRSGFRGFEDAMENILPGRRHFLEGQQDQLKDMLERTRTGITKPILDSNGVRVSDTAAMAEGLKEQYKANKAAAKALFDRVEQLASQQGVQPIAPTTLHQTAADLVAERPAFFAELQDNPLWKKLVGVERDAGPQNSIIIQTNGQPFKKPQLLDFSEVKALRSRLGSEYRSARLSDPEKARAFSLLLKSLDDDLNTWGQNTGNKALDKAYDAARTHYRENVVPYTDPSVNPSKSPIFANVAFKDSVDSDTIGKGVFKTDRGQLAQDFMDLASPRGQQAAKNELIDEIVSSGLNADTETGLSNAMIRHSSRYREPGAAVFNPGEQAALGQAVDTLKHTRRAAQLAPSDPKTGMRLGPWAAVGAVGGSSVPLYYGLNAMFGEQMSPTERVATSFVLYPLAAYAAAKGGLRYSQSDLGKLIHFADSEIHNPVLGALQRAARGTGKGAGANATHQWQRGMLGQRMTADPDLEEEY